MASNVGTVTKILTSGESIAIVASWGIKSVAIKAPTGGTGTFTGTGRYPNGSGGFETSDAIPVVENDPVTIGAPTTVLDGITITCTGGSLYVIMLPS